MPIMHRRRFPAGGRPSLTIRLPIVLSCRAEARVWLQSPARCHDRKLPSSLLLVGITVACSPRDFLTRRLATDLIAGSDSFKTHPAILAANGRDLQQRLHFARIRDLAPARLDHGQRRCLSSRNCCSAVLGHGDHSAGSGRPARLGFRDRSQFSIHQRASGTERTAGGHGHSQGRKSWADVDFLWRWAAVNEVGAALYARNYRVQLHVGFVHYDDGWRVIEGGGLKGSQSLSEALKNARQHSNRAAVSFSFRGLRPAVAAV